MGGVGYFFRLAVEGFMILQLIWPAGYMIFVGTIWAVVLFHILPEAHRRKALVGALIPLVIPAVILVCGVLLVNDIDSDTLPPRWPEWIIGGLLLSHLPLTAVLIWWQKGARWFVLCASLAVASYSCGAAFVSIMSVSGRWL